MGFAAACICAAALLLLGANAASVGNDQTLMGWHDFHLNVKDEKTAEVIRDFAQQHNLLIARENYLEYPEDVVVSPNLVDTFKQVLHQHSVQFDIPETDVGALLLKEKVENMVQSLSFNSDPSTYFAQSPAIYSWLRGLADGSFAQIDNIGKSHEGRDLLVLKLSTNPSANRPIIFVDSTIHAREWLAPATLNFIIKSFINDRNTAEVRALFDKYDWYFMPLVNPDGYDYSFRSRGTRFWRKTRKPYGFNFGADGNRNFDFQFGGAGTSNNPRSDIYHGPKPFSEPETLALSQFLTRFQSRVQRGMYVSFHTYGQLLLTPPGYTRRNQPDHDEMMRVGNIAAEAIVSAGGPRFRVGQPANIGLYEAAGGSYDWVKYKLGVKYSYTPELRPRWPAGLGGFVARVQDIPLSGREMYAALKAAANALQFP